MQTRKAFMISLARALALAPASCVAAAIKHDRIIVAARAHKQYIQYTSSSEDVKVAEVDVAGGRSAVLELRRGLHLLLLRHPGRWAVGPCVSGNASCSSTFLFCVPSLSWQMVVFHKKVALGTAVSHRRAHRDRFALPRPRSF